MAKRTLGIVCAGAILLACYAPVLAGMVRQWAGDADMSHGFLVAPAAAIVVWRRRKELRRIPLQTNWWGVGIVVLGGLQMLLGALAAQVFLVRTAFLVSLTGAVLFVGGTRALRSLAFPLLVLLFLFPIPAMVYARVTLSLQLVASAAAEGVLNVVGIPVLREGNILELANERISVVEACSGIRSLMSLAFLSLVYGYFFDRRVTVRWILLGASIPAAIAANAARVTIRAIAGGGFHLFEGWTLFLVALGLLVGSHQLMRNGVGTIANAAR